jgi:acetyl-CoA C-acetyltransferase
MVMDPRAAVIVSAARTPIGKFMGCHRDVPATTLGATTIQHAVERAGLTPDEVEYVLMGQVLQAGQGQNPARQAAVRAGVPMRTPAATINKVCLASLNAIALARQMILLGEADVIVAGGMESMSRAPHLCEDLRGGRRMGAATLRDAMLVDGLWCAFDDVAMGASADAVHARERISRQDQDHWALESQRRAAAATAEGRFRAELVAVPGADGTATSLRDECIRPDTAEERLASLPPAFGPNGTVTAGNASQLSDGAAAVVVMSRQRAERERRDILAEIVAHSMVAGPDATLHPQPVNAIRSMLARSGYSRRQIDLFEINEAFAGVAVFAARELELPRDRVNVNGGAVALGHPLGCTGARLVVTLLHELRRRGGGMGIATLCGGGGQGEALMLQVA